VKLSLRAEGVLKEATLPYLEESEANKSKSEEVIERCRNERAFL